MSDFASVIRSSRAAVGLRYYVRIGGLPYVFHDGEVPVGPDGTAWAALASKGRSYEALAHTLDPSEMTDNGPEVSRLTAQVRPGTLKLRLLNDRDDTLTRLFARDRPGGRTANLEASVGLDVGGGGTVFDTTDLTGWANSGYAYFGTETVYYPARTSTTLGTTLSKCTRDLFSVGQCDRRYFHQTANLGSPRIISDYPRTWHGRIVQVFAFLVGLDGTAFDAGYDGDYSREVWRGVLTGMPTVSRDWHAFELQTASIDRLLNTEVGPPKMTGRMLRSFAQVYTGSQPLEGVPLSQAIMILDANTSSVDVTVRQWATLADKESGAAPAAVHEYVGPDRFALATGVEVLTTQQLRKRWADQVEATLLADVTGLTAATLDTSSERRKWVLGVRCDGTVVLEVTFHMGEAGSVGFLLGFVGAVSLSVVPVSSGAYGIARVMSDELEPALLYLHPFATAIPFFWPDAQGLQETSPAEPGYAVIGDGDEMEVVSYESIVDAGSSVLDGLYYMTGVERGRMNTAPREHVVVFDPDSEPKDIDIRFGVGWEDASPFDILLQLAVSTGEAGYRGTYDVLAERVGPAISPANFHLPSFKAASESAAPWERQVDFLLLEPMKITELLSRWMQPLGRYVYAGIDPAGDFRIHVRELAPALEAAVVDSFGADDLSAQRPAELRHQGTRIINIVHANYLWDPVEGESVKGAKVSVYNHDSIEEHNGERRSLTWTLVGYRLDDATATVFVNARAAQVFARYSSPFDIAILDAGRRGWLVSTGDTIRVSVPAMPTAEGGRGYVDRLATVLSLTRQYSDGGAELTCIIDRELRYSTYAPSGLIEVYTAGTPSIRIAEQAFSAVGIDADHFDVGDVVWIYQDPGDVSTRVQRTVTAKSGSELTLSATLPWSILSGQSLVTYADHGDATSTQRAHAYVALDAGEYSNGDAAIRYS